MDGFFDLPDDPGLASMASGLVGSKPSTAEWRVVMVIVGSFLDG
ncbi:MAG TPA: hypothetical protein VKP64_12135 [Mycobacteriales bacterium]|nr:hypothetical protein [Mycobacteriales bacterium]